MSKKNKDEDDDFGYFDEPKGDGMSDDKSDNEMSDEEMAEMMSQMDEDTDSYKGEELRLTHLALRQQLLRDAMGMLKGNPKWNTLPLKARLMELQATYRVMTKLTEDE